MLFPLLRRRAHLDGEREAGEGVTRRCGVCGAQRGSNRRRDFASSHQFSRHIEK